MQTSGSQDNRYEYINEMYGEAEMMDDAEADDRRADAMEVPEYQVGSRLENDGPSTSDYDAQRVHQPDSPAEQAEVRDMYIQIYNNTQFLSQLKLKAYG